MKANFLKRYNAAVLGCMPFSWLGVAPPYRREHSSIGFHAALAVAIPFASVGLSFNTAYADATNQDWKGYAGVNCLPQSNNSEIRRSAVAHPAFANTGASADSVFCPVVRDVSEGAPNRVTEVRLRVRNRGVTPLSCEFRSWDINGGLVASATAAAAAGSDFQTLTMGPVPVSASNWGSYTLICQLPGRHPSTSLPSYIINYRVDERCAAGKCP